MEEFTEASSSTEIATILTVSF
uniref:Uncharacterized protein n=1 Tax=Anguilla anguilla TaxID=7936 RepID=A0A0E9XP13_ANGAN